MKFKFFPLLLLTFLIVSCDSGDGAEILNIPSDPTGTYEILSLEILSEHERILTTKRTGSSGTDYSKIFIDCNIRKFRGLGEGETIEEMNKERITDMFEVVGRSIKYYQVEYACSK